MTTLVFGITATDPATYALVSLALIGTAVLAAIFRRVRLLKVDLVVALRAE